jgi:polyphosphate kinase 2 (PPK2 family)
MSGVNPQGVRVSSFKVPSAEELNHDYLWRYARRLPGRGEIGIFNRSHYEEVLVVRVHPENLNRQKLPSAAKGRGFWARRYREINDWELSPLADNGRQLTNEPSGTGACWQRSSPFATFGWRGTCGP